MKKNNLIKIIITVFICTVFLSWIIPAGIFEKGAFVASTQKPAGLFDLTLIPLTVFDLALPSILFVLVVGIFYGVINKTGVYTSLVEKMTDKLKGHEICFAVTTSVVISLLSAITGLNITFFVVIPFISAIMLSLGLSKITTMISTFGSIIVGMAGSIYGNDIAYYLNGYLGYNSDYGYNYGLFPSKIILLILLVFLLAMFVLNCVRKNLKNKDSIKEEIPLYEKTKESKNKKSYMPLFIIMIVSFVIIMIGSFKWDALLGTTENPTPFLSFYEKIMSVKVNGFPIIANILGTIPAFGYWELPFISVFILFVTIIIGIVYKVKFDDIIEGSLSGLTKNVRLALYIIGANLVFSLLFRNGTSENFVATIINFFMNIPDNFNSLIVSVTTVISSFFYNSFGTLVANMYLPTVILTGTTAELRLLATTIIQTLYSLVMLIAPTSVLLIVGLSYFNISYKEWFKNIWKLLLQLLIVVVLIIIILTIFSL